MKVPACDDDDEDEEEEEDPNDEKKDPTRQSVEGTHSRKQSSIRSLPLHPASHFPES